MARAAPVGNICGKTAPMASQTSDKKSEISYASALKLAIPASIAAMATPLLGAIDVWALGRSPRPLDIAAVGLGSVIFSLIYWTFGFIRMSVAGLTAQAMGAGDEAAARTSLAHGFAIGALIGTLLLISQSLIGLAAFSLLSIGSEASAATMAAAQEYFSIRIWGAPFALATYALFGWFTGRARTDFLMIASLAMTALNVALDYWFVVELEWGAWGVGLGTLLAEISGFAISVGFALVLMKRHGGVKAHWSRGALRDPVRVKRTLSINTDIFIRTLLLAISFAWFTQRSGTFGDVTLAANQALLQLFLFTGLALDGTAIAAETFVGNALGDDDRVRGRARFYRGIKVTAVPALVLACVFTLAYLLFGREFVALLAPAGEIRDTALSYLPWIVISPLVLVSAFQLDGIFVGATRAREMRNAMIVCTTVLLPLSVLMANAFGNHGLWMAFSLYFVLRAISLAIYWPRLTRAF